MTDIDTNIFGLVSNYSRQHAIGAYEPGRIIDCRHAAALSESMGKGSYTLCKRRQLRRLPTVRSSSLRGVASAVVDHVWKCCT